MVPAQLQTPLEDGAVRCNLCAHYCRIPPGATGRCRVRMNREGRLFSLNADRVIATHSDPIEKKPLYHFLPGTPSFSLAAMGCNFRCPFCQNHTISQVDPRRGPQGEALSPARLVEAARAAGCRSVAYTYTEPTVFFELMLETARLARAAGLRNVMVTNGYISREGLAQLAPWLDAANVDLKAGTDDFYREQCGARLQPVLDSITAMHAAGIWVEVTTLLIPGLNTEAPHLEGITTFLHDLDPAVPWHVSRYHPQFNMNRPPTQTRAVHAALTRGREAGLLYLYAGNLPDGEWTNTLCPRCGAVLITRRGFSARVRGMENGKCRACGEGIAGVWE